MTNDSHKLSHTYADSNCKFHQHMTQLLSRSVIMAEYVTLYTYGYLTSLSICLLI